MKGDWQRVSRKCRCPICNHDSWCLIATDGVICMRVQSSRVVHFKGGETGYVHPLNGTPQLPNKQSKPEPTINCTALLNEWSHVNSRPLCHLALRLGVSENSLARLNCIYAREHNAWAFPMRDGYGELVGIRLRNDRGDKWAIKGSHQGIFLPFTDPQEICIICEGPTDTAAALSMGFFAIGRPSCSGGVQYVRTAIRRFGVRRAIIMSDNDEPGMKGAFALAEFLPIPSCILLLPCKDLRQMLCHGGTKETIMNMVESVVWRQPQVCES